MIAWLCLQYRPHYSLAVAALAGIDPVAAAAIERGRARVLASRLLKASKRDSRRDDGSSFRIQLPRADVAWLAGVLPTHWGLPKLLLVDHGLHPIQ